MKTTDPIADLLTRIRNAQGSQKEQTTIPHSRVKLAILQVMKDRKFIKNFKEQKNDKFTNIVVDLDEDRRYMTLKRISKPGQRIYVKSSAIKKVNGGLGLAILSTPKGIMSGEDASKQKLGGEIICEIF